MKRTRSTGVTDSTSTGSAAARKLRKRAGIRNVLRRSSTVAGVGLAESSWDLSPSEDVLERGNRLGQVAVHRTNPSFEYTRGLVASSCMRCHLFSRRGKCPQGIPREGRGSVTEIAMVDIAYAESRFRAPEIRHGYGPQVHLLDDPFAWTLLARACSPDTGQPDMGRLVRMLYERARAHGAGCRISASARRRPDAHGRLPSGGCLPRRALARVTKAVTVGSPAPGRCRRRSSSS
jgi:hypothetical protein